MARRISFLPAFFAVLVVAFAVVAAVRLRSLSRPPAAQSVQAVTETPASTDVRATSPAIDTSSGETPKARPTQAERDRKYRELLQRPAAVPAPSGQPQPQRPAEPRSIFSRLVAPIVTAFGGASSRSASAPSPQAPAPVNQSGPASREAGNKPALTDTRDPNSDTTPPQLLSIEFNPPAVHDGEETIMTITATDDLSGVRMISGNIASPSGALQGFAVDHIADSNRYVARIGVPRNAAEGLWHVNFLTLTDAASNTGTLSWKQGTVPQSAAFRVTSSKPDTTPPTLKSIVLEQLSIRAGEKDALVIDADDDASGVALIGGAFASPAKFARLPFACHPQSGTTWRCDFTAMANADCGDWQLEQVQLQDKANNLQVFRTDNPMIAAVRVNISSESCDSRPPVVQSVTIDATTIGSPGQVNVSVMVTDDASGVANVSGNFIFTGAVAGGSQPPRVYFSCRPGSETQPWVGVVMIPAKAARGVWRLGTLQVIDKAGNLKIYVDPDPVTAGVAFRVE